MLPRLERWLHRHDTLIGRLGWFIVILAAGWFLGPLVLWGTP